MASHRRGRFPESAQTGGRDAHDVVGRPAPNPPVPDDGLEGVRELQRTAGNRALSRAIERGTVPGFAQLQRDQATIPTIKGKPGAKLSPKEAVHQIQLKLLMTDGLMSTLHKALGGFQRDMTTTLGWYAGEKKASSKESKNWAQSAEKAIVEAAQHKAKDVVKDGLKILAEEIPKVGGVAGTVAGYIGNALEKYFDKVADYDPVITEVARKKPHQHYIESVDKTLSASSGMLVEVLTLNEEELATDALEDLAPLIGAVDSAIARAHTLFYFDLVQGYRAIAPASTVELETPHAQFTGEKRGLWGGGTYVTPIKSGTVYVELSAGGVTLDDVEVVRTIVPELPTGVMESLNDMDESITLGHLAGTAELLMEGKMGGWAMRLVRDKSSKLVPADAPSNTKQYLQALNRAMGGSAATQDEQAMNGATALYAKVVGLPLTKARLST